MWSKLLDKMKKLTRKQAAVLVSVAAMVFLVAAYFLYAGLGGLKGEAVMGHIPPAEDDFMYYGQEIQIRSDCFNNFLSARGSTQKAAVNLQVEALDSEVWKLINPDNTNDTGPVKFNGKVAFQSVKHGNYLSTNSTGDKGAAYLMGASSEDAWWRIVNTYDRTGNAQVSRIDTVLIRSWKYNGYLSAFGDYKSDTAIKTMQNAGSWEKWAIQPKDYYMKWMETTSRIQDKPLREITFPASHDAGAKDFTDTLAQEEDNATLAGILDALHQAEATVDDMATITILGEKFQIAPNIISNIKGYAMPIYLRWTKALATTTDLSVEQQLCRGVRWLDLRIQLQSDGDTIHHMLVGQKVAPMMDQVKGFLNSTKGEIVVVEMSHYVGAMGSYESFVNGVVTLFGDHIYTKTRDSSGKVLNPLDKTYSEIVGPDAASRTSKVILLDGDDPEGLASASDSVWTYAELGLKPGPGTSNYGYSNDTDRGKMIADQVAKFKKAKAAGEPFTLWYTLTTNADDGKKIVGDKIITPLVGSLRNAYMKQGGKYLVWVFSPALGYALNKGFDALDRLTTPHPGYNTTRELTARLDAGSGLVFEKNFQSRSNPYGYNAVNVLYGDYFTFNTDLVDVAIDYSRLPTKEQVTQAAANSAYPKAQDITSGGWYYIKNKFTGKYLGVNNSLDADGAQVQHYQINYTKAQQWKVTYNSNGLYTLESAAAPGRVLDIYSADNAGNARTDIWDDNGSPGMQFALEASPDANDGATYRIRTACSDLQMMVVANAAGKTQTSADVAQNAYVNDAIFNEEWTFEPLPSYTNPYPAQPDLLANNPGGIFYIVNRAYPSNEVRNRVLAVPNGTDQNGTRLVIQYKEGYNNQLWKIEEAGDGLYRFVSFHGSSPRVLDIAISNNTDGAFADIWRDNQTLSTRFALKPTGQKSGVGYVYYTIYTEASNFTKALAVQGASMNVGTNVNQYNYTADTTYNDEWCFIPAIGFKPIPKDANILDDTVYYLRNKSTGNYMYLTDGADKNGAVVTQAAANGSKGQQWKITYVPEVGQYILQSFGGDSSRVLNISPAGNMQGAGVNISDYNQSWGQYFILKPDHTFTGNDDPNEQVAYQIITQCSDLECCVAGGRGTSVCQSATIGSALEFWYLEPVVPVGS